MSGTASVAEVRERRVAGFGGLSLAVQERGEAGRPPVVLVHGYPDDHAVWDLVADRLAADHHVVTYDVRGAGASEIPADRAGYRIEALIADLDAVIGATSPDRPVHLVAHDWGSIQSWSAVTDPVVGRRFASFTSMSGPGLDHVAAWIRAHRIPGRGRWRDARRQAVRSWYIAAFRTSIPAKVWERGRLADGFPLLLERVDGARVDDRWPGPNLVANGVNGIELYRANMYGRTAPKVPPTTQVPVQLVVPVGDRYVTPALLDGMERVAPNLVRREVGGGHWIPRSNPDLVARLVAEHVAVVEAGRALTPDPERDVVVVTGAGSGIGRSVSLAFAERGAHVIATDLRTDTVARTAELCRLLGGTAESHALDVTDGDAFDELAARVAAEHGAPSIVVNNAGLGMAGAFLDTTDEDWDLLLDVNLRGVIRGSRTFGRLMVDGGRAGHIVNI
ncbi:MAG TPA: SDR family oxidoreductase, partial [Acidimicrobiales bacterium]|nr:SDR family oxidoreductase [Acidimicrobiales bacterium]